MEIKIPRNQSRNYTLKGLLPWSTYHVVVIAYNMFNGRQLQSKPSHALVVQTLESSKYLFWCPTRSVFKVHFIHLGLEISSLEFAFLSRCTVFYLCTSGVSQRWTLGYTWGAIGVPICHALVFDFSENLLHAFQMSLQNRNGGSSKSRKVLCFPLSNGYFCFWYVMMGKVHMAYNNAPTKEMLRKGR